MLFGMLPWTFLMLDTVWRTWRESARPAPPVHGLWGGFFTHKAFNPERYLLIWVVFVFLFFSKSDSKLPSYVLPLFPALALLMGKQLASMNARRLFWLAAPVLPVLV